MQTKNFKISYLISCIDKLILIYCTLWKWWLGPQYFVLSKNTFLNRFSSQCGDACWSRTTDTYDLCSHMMLGQVCPRMECLECHWIKIIPRTTKQTDWRLVSDGFWESTRKMSFIWAIGFCKKMSNLYVDFLAMGVLRKKFFKSFLIYLSNLGTRNISYLVQDYVKKGEKVNYEVLVVQLWCAYAFGKCIQKCFIK